MFSSLILSVVSTAIIGGIVYIIFKLIFARNSNFDESDEPQQQQESVVNEFIDNRPKESDKCLIDEQEKIKSDPKPRGEEEPIEEVFKSDKQLDTEKLIPHKEVAIDERPDQNNDRSADDNQTDDLLGFEELIPESNELTDEKPIQRQVINEVVVNHTQSQLELEPRPDEPVSCEQFSDDKEVIEELCEPQETELTDQFWDLEDSQNLKHLNKSRPKKHKSRPSFKAVFADNLTDQPINDGPIAKSAGQLVDTLFENIGSDVQQFKNKTDDENSFNDKTEEQTPEYQTVFESKVVETVEKTIDKNDDSFEEISSGEYKKFDEFSDSFRTETRKHEVSRNVYEISSVKSFEITVDSNEPIDEQLFDKLMKNFDPNDAKTHVFEENYNKVTESETLELIKGDQTTRVVPISNSETVSHTKSLTERSLSNSSLSKTSLDDLNLKLNSSKSRFSETIDSVTKPLLSSPTLFRRSIVKNDDEIDANNDVNESSSSTQIPFFGRSQSSLMKEMKEKEFRKSLKPFNEFNDKNMSTE